MVTLTSCCSVGFRDNFRHQFEDIVYFSGVHSLGNLFFLFRGNCRAKNIKNT